MSSITESPVVFTNEDMQIVGMIHRPAAMTESKPTAVVFFHGCTTSRTEAHWIFVKMARALSKNGIMALRFDFRFSGESEGDFQDMTLSDEVSDAIRSVDYLVSDCGADPERIGIVGMSMGGAIGAITAGRLRDRIVSCVLLNPVGRLHEDLSAIAESNNINTSSFPIEWKSLLFGRAFFDDLKNINPLEEIVHATCPVLIINGTADTSVSPKRSREYYKTLRNNGQNAELMLIDGADHVFTSVAWEHEIIEKVSGWFMRTL